MLDIPDEIQQRVNKKLEEVDHARRIAAGKEHWKREEELKRRPWKRKANRNSGNGSAARFKT